MENNKWWMQALKGVLFTIIGFIAIINPGDALMTLGLYIGYMSLFTGVIYMYNSLFSKSYDRSGWFLAEGLLDVLFGVILVFNPAITLELLPFMLGFWIIFMGITQFSTGFAMRKILRNRQWLLYILGIISVVCGMILLNSGILVSLTVATFLGIYFTVYGVFLIFSSIKLKKGVVL